MKRSILIPTDFSDNAWNAVVYALKLYANEDCNFYFLHAWTLSNANTRTYITTHFVDNLEDDSIKELNTIKTMAEAANPSANHSFNVVFSKDKLQKAIEDNVKAHNIDMIIMGTKGATKAKEILLGSNTVNIIKKIKTCPVLVVPDEFEFVEPKQIAFPTDFSRFFGEELQPIKRLAKLYNSQIRIVHITKKNKLSKKQDYNLSMLNVNFEEHAHSFHWMPNYADKTQEINDFIEELDINMLVMINYKHSFIENILNEPVVSKIGFSPTVPFLAIPCSG
jgi:nucleotide-binding universal stress UspA family protein